jgi:hypothetical protein
MAMAMVTAMGRWGDGGGCLGVLSYLINLPLCADAKSSVFDDIRFMVKYDT